MTHNLASSYGSVDRATIEAGIRRAHELRSQFISHLVVRAAKAIAGWVRFKAPERQLGHLSEYVLKDIGLRPDQLSGLATEALRRDELALSPAGNASAPAFRRSAARAAEVANENIDTPMAA